MGLKSHSACAVVPSKCAVSTDASIGNPDPKNFQIVYMQAVGPHTVATVVYPDSKNYEGKKVLLYRNATPADIEKQTTLDPHFCDDGSHLSPFARFEPTQAGWEAAVALARVLA